MSFQDVFQRMIDDDINCINENAKHLKQVTTVDESIEVMHNTKRFVEMAIKELEALKSYSILEETYKDE